MNKTNQEDYIKYLEERLKKLSKKAISENQDLDTLIDVQNEILFNEATSKHPLRSNSPKQIEQLQKRILVSDEYIKYLMNSFWWRISYPIRLVIRHIKNHSNCKPFDFSVKATLKEPVEAVIYAEAATSDLIELIANLREQNNVNNLIITIVDLIGSKNIAKIAKTNNTKYVNMLIMDKEITMAKTVLNKQTKYAVYVGQDFHSDTKDWLYKIVRPIADKYTPMSVLYDKRNPNILSIERETFFKELKTRIIDVDDYKCLYLPSNRDNIQYIPITILDQASVIAKKVN